MKALKQKQRRKGTKYKRYLSHDTPLTAAPRRSRTTLRKRMLFTGPINLELNPKGIDVDDDHQECSASMVLREVQEVTDERLQQLQENNSDLVIHDADDEFLETYMDNYPLNIDEPTGYLLSDNESDCYADEDWAELDYEDEIAIQEEEEMSDKAAKQTKTETCEDLPEDQLLYDGAHITLGTSVLLIMTFAMTHSISGAALSNLLDLIDVHCKKTNLCATSIHKFKNFFCQLNTPLCCHYYCQFCQGLLEDGLSISTCPYCKKTLEKDLKLKKSYFIEIPIQQQLADLFLSKSIKISFTNYLSLFKEYVMFFFLLIC